MRPEELYSKSLAFRSGQAKDQAKAGEFLLKAAKAGYPQAQYEMGIKLREGPGTKQPDYAAAGEWFRKAAKAGHAKAQAEAAFQFFRGQGVDPDYLEAMAYIRKALAQEEPDAYALMGKFYEWGRGVPRDFRIAVDYYNEAIGMGSSWGQFYLGAVYEVGLRSVVDKDQKAALEFFRKAADQGLVAAYSRVADIYYDQKNKREEAVEWYRKGADFGYPHAQLKLARILLNDEKSDASKKEARQLLEQCAGAENFECIEDLISLKSRSIASSAAEAKLWKDETDRDRMRLLLLRSSPLLIYMGAEDFEREGKMAIALPLYSAAADLGELGAVRRLGEIYSKGLENASPPVAADIEKAIRYYDKAIIGWPDLARTVDCLKVIPWMRTLAAEGNASALERLAFYGEVGLCGMAEDEEAQNLLKKAAAKKNPKAMARFGATELSRSRIEEGKGLLADAARYGDPDVWHEVALIYTKNPHLGDMREEGVALLRRAAQAGNPMSMMSLAECYENGTGVPKSISTAALWCLRFDKEYFTPLNLVKYIPPQRIFDSFFYGSANPYASNKEKWAGFIYHARKEGGAAWAFLRRNKGVYLPDLLERLGYEYANEDPEKALETFLADAGSHYGIGDEEKVLRLIESHFPVPEGPSSNCFAKAGTPCPEGDGGTPRIVPADAPKPTITPSLPERETYKDPLTGMEFVFVPPGSFYAGKTGLEINPGAEKYREREDVLPTFEVTFPRGFWLGKYEVTREQWKKVMGDGSTLDLKNKSPEGRGRWVGVWESDDNAYFRTTYRNRTGEEKKSLPAIGISWEEAQIFIERLVKQTGKRYRLPSEVEWEYAAKGGVDHVYAGTSDRQKVKDYAWYNRSFNGLFESFVREVGTKLPNPFGLYDMTGNAAEWVEDDYVVLQWGRIQDYERASALQRGGPWVESPRGKERVVRGEGVWPNEEYLDELKVYLRKHRPADEQWPGLRLMLEQ